MNKQHQVFVVVSSSSSTTCSAFRWLDRTRTSTPFSLAIFETEYRSNTAWAFFSSSILFLLFVGGSIDASSVSLLSLASLEDETEEEGEGCRKGQSSPRVQRPLRKN